MSVDSVFDPAQHSSVRVLVSPGGISAPGETLADLTQAIGEGIRDVIRDADVVLAPLADGGEGTSQLFVGERITLPTTNAAGSLIEATYTFDADSATAYIDLASAAGAPDTQKARDEGDTYGVGVLVADAETRGARRVVLSLGDAVTNDAGTGILVALAVNPVNADGYSVPKGAIGLPEIADLDTAKLNVGASALEWVLLADSMDPVDTSHEGLRHFAEVSGVDPTQPGYGAGGAVALGLTWLSSIIYGGDTAHVRVLPAVEVVADSLDVGTHAQDADLVVTAGPAAQAVLRLAPEATVGVIGKPVDGAAVTAALEGETIDAWRRAGAHLAADYLRISTVQG